MHLRGGFQSKKRWCGGSSSVLRKSTIAHWCVFWQTFCSNKHIKSHVPVGGLTCFLLSNQAATQSAKAKHCKEADSNDISLNMCEKVIKDHQRYQFLRINHNKLLIKVVSPQDPAAKAITLHVAIIKQHDSPFLPHFIFTNFENQ